MTIPPPDDPSLSPPSGLAATPQAVNGVREDFSGAVESRAWQALRQIEVEVLASYDGARWLAQQGYERVALGLEYRSDRKGRALRSVGETGRLLSPEYSVVWPELETASVDEMREYLRPVVLEALALVGERKKLGELPRTGQVEAGIEEMWS